jgi:transcription initiation factor IIF auxiliary subunit
MHEEVIECSICFVIIVEPIRISCSHLYCLDCIERLLTGVDDDIRCPMDRKAFDYRTDIKYDESVFIRNYNLQPNECKKVIDSILSNRLDKKNLKEYRIAYGNLHEYIPSENNNNHKWVAFAYLKECDLTKKNLLDGFKYRFNLFWITNSFDEKLKALEENKKLIEDLEIDQNRIIKRVTYKLHPTFNPSCVFVQESPFEITRYGWGAFNITLNVEFQDNLNIQNLELDHFICFEKPSSENYKQIFIDVDNLK